MTARHLLAVGDRPGAPGRGASAARRAAWPGNRDRHLRTVSRESPSSAATLATGGPPEARARRPRTRGRSAPAYGQRPGRRVIGPCGQPGPLAIGQHQRRRSQVISGSPYYAPTNLRLKGAGRGARQPGRGWYVGPPARALGDGIRGKPRGAVPCAARRGC